MNETCLKTQRDAREVLMQADFLEEVDIPTVPGTRWFSNQQVDLLVEVDPQGHLRNFTLSYRQSSANLSLEWDGFQLRSFQFDESETPSSQQSPGNSGAENQSDSKEAYDLFQKIGVQLDPDIFDFVSSRLASRVF